MCRLSSKPLSKIITAVVSVRNRERRKRRDEPRKLVEMAKAQDSACSEGNKETTCSLTGSLTAMAPDAPAAEVFPLYVRWTLEGAVETVELPSSATVADLMMASMAGHCTSGVLSFQGAELVDGDALLCDVGVCPETFVDFGPRTVVRVSILNIGWASWWSDEIFDIPADDFDGFIAALRSKMLEKIRYGSAGYHEKSTYAEFLSSLEEHHLSLVPYDSNPLQSTWRLEIPAAWESKLTGDLYRGNCIEVFFQVWKSADAM